jgi:flagellar biosynthesis protein FlhF
MKIKKFVAQTLKEGKDKILRELGEEAIILSSRTIDNAVEGQLIEIVAAIDNKPLQKSKLSILGPRTRDFSAKGDDETKLLETTSHIYSELSVIKSKINDLSDNLKYKNIDLLKPMVGEIYKSLLISGFTEPLSYNLASKLNKENIEDATKLLARAREIVASFIGVNTPIKKSSKRKVCVFVGPTGTGKTTTVAKLGIIGKLALDAKTQIISADHKKVGGSEQMQTYALISGIPFEIVYNPDELNTVLRKENNYDLVLIDTFGLSQNDKENLTDLFSYIDRDLVDIVFLVCSATSDSRVLEDIFLKFSSFSPDSIILTKTDESKEIGRIIEILKKEKLDVSYLTSGQKIPDDIEPADSIKIAKMILPDNIGIKTK